jgi:hypothetical protein
MESSGMSHAGHICGAGFLRHANFQHYADFQRHAVLFAESPIDGIVGTTPVRPGRGRTRGKENVEDKDKSVPGAKKKSPPQRKAPSRGRYVDEYAHPPG